jgi:hypothetical protein
VGFGPAPPWLMRPANAIATTTAVVIILAPLILQYVSTSAQIHGSLFLGSFPMLVILYLDPLIVYRLFSMVKTLKAGMTSPWNALSNSV